MAETFEPGEPDFSVKERLEHARYSYEVNRRAFKQGFIPEPQQFEEAAIAFARELYNAIRYGNDDDGIVAIRTILHAAEEVGSEIVRHDRFSTPGDRP